MNQNLHDAKAVIREPAGNIEMPGRRPRKRKQHELVGFVAIWAVQYQKDYGLDGLHPTHYDLIEKYGGRMDSFTRATNARLPQEGETAHD